MTWDLNLSLLNPFPVLVECCRNVLRMVRMKSPKNMIGSKIEFPFSAYLIEKKKNQIKLNAKRICF